MIGVDKIGEICRAYVEQRRPIKEIVRTLSVSRATVRKVIRGHETEFKYGRCIQPTPKLGVWVEGLTEVLEMEDSLPRRERRSSQRRFKLERLQMLLLAVTGGGQLNDLPPCCNEAVFDLLKVGSTGQAEVEAFIDQLEIVGKDRQRLLPFR